MVSSKLKKAFGIVFFLTFFSSTIQEKSFNPPEIIRYSLNSLEIEQLKTINLLEGDFGDFRDFNFLKKLEEGSTFIENKNLATDKEIKNLKLMIKKFEKSKFSREEYKKKEFMMNLFRKIKKFLRKKKKLKIMKLFHMGNCSI